MSDSSGIDSTCGLNPQDEHGTFLDDDEDFSCDYSVKYFDSTNKNNSDKTMLPSGFSESSLNYIENEHLAQTNLAKLASSFLFVDSSSYLKHNATSSNKHVSFYVSY